MFLLKPSKFHVRIEKTSVFSLAPNVLEASARSTSADLSELECLNQLKLLE